MTFDFHQFQYGPWTHLWGSIYKYELQPRCTFDIYSIYKIEHGSWILHRYTHTLPLKRFLLSWARNQTLPLFLKFQKEQLMPAIFKWQANTAIIIGLDDRDASNDISKQLNEKPTSSWEIWQCAFKISIGHHDCWASHIYIFKGILYLLQCLFSSIVMDLQMLNPNMTLYQCWFHYHHILH